MQFYCFVFNFVKKIYFKNCCSIWFAGLRAIICFSLIAASLTGKCQWKVFHTESRNINPISLSPSWGQLKEGYTFFGLSDNFDEDVITKGYEPEQDGSTEKVQGFCGKSYSSGVVTCKASYSSRGISNTSEELNILI